MRRTEGSVRGGSPSRNKARELRLIRAYQKNPRPERPKWWQKSPSMKWAAKKGVEMTGIPQMVSDVKWTATHPVDRLTGKGRAANPQMVIPWGPIKAHGIRAWRPPRRTKAVGESMTPEQAYNRNFGDHRTVDHREGFKYDPSKNPRTGQALYSNRPDYQSTGDHLRGVSLRSLLEDYKANAGEHGGKEFNRSPGRFSLDNEGRPLLETLYGSFNREEYAKLGLNADFGIHRPIAKYRKKMQERASRVRENSPTEKADEMFMHYRAGKDGVFTKYKPLQEHGRLERRKMNHWPANAGARPDVKYVQEEMNLIGDDPYLASVIRRNPDLLHIITGMPGEAKELLVRRLLQTYARKGRN